MAIGRKARNNMPVQVRCLVAKAGQVHFGWIKQIAQGLLHRKDNPQEGLPIRLRQVRHFLYVRIPYHAAKHRVVGIINEHHADPLIAPQYDTAIRITQFAGQFKPQNCSREMGLV